MKLEFLLFKISELSLEFRGELVCEILYFSIRLSFYVHNAYLKLSQFSVHIV